MEILMFVLIWPFLILVAGLVFISAGDILFFDSGDFSGMAIARLILAALFLWLIFGHRKKDNPGTIYEQLEELKRIIITASIAFLFPILMQYVVSGFNSSIGVMIVGLLAAFGAITVGMFIKNNYIIATSSIFGGALALVYLYSQLWQLGDGARIVAAAFGLVMAVGLSIAKLKDRLV
jgi:hypothetical protein